MERTRLDGLKRALAASGLTANMGGSARRTAPRRKRHILYNNAARFLRLEAAPAN